MGKEVEKELNVKQQMDTFVRIKRAYEVLDQFTDKELIAYEEEVKRIADNRAAEEFAMKQAKAQGKAQGMAEGMAEAMIEIARNLLAEGIDIEIIANATGLEQEKIRSLKSEYVQILHILNKKEQEKYEL